MTEKIKRINNPLTIIAIFAALAEINATVAISLIDPSLHSIFIWFVIGFPTLLVLLFFLTLNYNTKVMYSPSDYKDEKYFVDSLYGNYNKSTITTNIDFSNINQKMELLESNLNKSIEVKLKEISTVKPDLHQEISKIKEQLKAVTDSSIREFADDYKISFELKAKLREFTEWPAYYVLLFAILKSNSQTIKQLKEFSKKFYLAGGWEDAILRFFDSNILLGSRENFKINPIYKTDLLAWAENNEQIIKTISEFNRDESNLTETEKTINNVRNMAKKIKF